MAMNLRADNTFVRMRMAPGGPNATKNFLRTRQGQRSYSWSWGWATTPGHHQISLLADDGEKSQGHLRLCQFRRRPLSPDIEKQSICLDADIGDVLSQIVTSPLSPGLEI